MRSIRFAGAALGLLLALPGRVAGADCPPPVPVMPPHPDARHVVLLATATPDTVAAGWADVSTERRPSRWRDTPVYGQVARAARVAGPGADALPPGPVVLVPWYSGCSNATLLWHSSFAWLRAGTPDVIVGRLRAPADWAGGVPTVDVLRTDLAKESGELPGAARWTATPEERFGFAATIPTRAALAADAWGATEPVRAWLAAHPAAARREPIRLDARVLYEATAHAAVRAAPSPLAGTYRVEVSRTGGLAHVVYARTERVPRDALFRADTPLATYPAAVPGYTLLASFRASEAQLPAPGAGPARRPGWLARLWRRPPRRVPADQLEVWFAGDSGGVQRFRGHLGLWNVAGALIQDDPELGRWIAEWSARERTGFRVQNPVGEVVLRPDGGVEWSEVMELAPGRAVTVRATRISGVALERSPDH